MRYADPLVCGHLIRRYKRFLADIRLDTGETITAHTPNTGSMLGCQTPGSVVWLRHVADARRKYPWSWELVETAPGVLVGINTGLPPRLVEEGIGRGVVSELQGYDTLRREVRYGLEGSRIDLLLEGAAGLCYVEVKNVTAAVEKGIALFPDAVSDRGTRHLRELMAMVGAGHRAVILYVVQRGDVEEVRPADAIDPRYGATLRAAIAAGVEARAYRASVSPDAVTLSQPLPVHCPSPR
jgi:sugar fermentation stimulation protein A